MTRQERRRAKRLAARIRRELERQMDTALLRDGHDEDVQAIYDGIQYVGGAAASGQTKGAIQIASQPTTPFCGPSVQSRSAARWRALRRLMRQAPILFDLGHKPFTESWFAGTAPVVRDYLGGNPLIDIDNVAFALLWRAKITGRLGSSALRAGAE